MSTTFLAVVGFVSLALILFLLIRGKGHPLVVFTLIPLVAALLCRYNAADINEFISKGMASVLPSLILFMFSITYFSLMHDAGLFDPYYPSPYSKKESQRLFGPVIYLTDHLCGSFRWIRHDNLYHCPGCLPSDDG